MIFLGNQIVLGKLGIKDKQVITSKLASQAQNGTDKSLFFLLSQTY